MSEIITREDGTQVEVYTAEELQSQKDEAIEEFKQTNPDKTSDLEALQAELNKANTELGKFQNKDLNFANLRSQKEAAEKRTGDLRAEIDAKIGLVKKEILEGVMIDHYNETLKSLSSDDAELSKKIEFHYKRLADTAATRQEVTKKLTDAYTLATAPEDKEALTSGVISSGGVSRVNIRQGESKFSPEEKALTQKLADAGNLGKLEDKDFR